MTSHVAGENKLKKKCYWCQYTLSLCLLGLRVRLGLEMGDGKKNRTERGEGKYYGALGILAAPLEQLLEF